MILDRETCLKRVEIFADSQEIADQLRQLTDDITDAFGPVSDLYWLKEAAEHIEGQHELTRSLATHLRNSTPKGD